MTIDLPHELYDSVVRLAADPPEIPISEWVRRVIAHHANYPMPPLRDRLKRKVRLDGIVKRKKVPEA